MLQLQIVKSVLSHPLRPQPFFPNTTKILSLYLPYLNARCRSTSLGSPHSPSSPPAPLSHSRTPSPTPSPAWCKISPRATPSMWHGKQLSHIHFFNCTAAASIIVSPYSPLGPSSPLAHLSLSPTNIRHSPCFFLQFKLTDGYLNSNRQLHHRPQTTVHPVTLDIAAQTHCYLHMQDGTGFSPALPSFGTGIFAIQPSNGTNVKWCLPEGSSSPVDTVEDKKCDCKGALSSST